MADAWSGNVRQLANVMERAALFTDAPTVTVEALGLTGATTAPVADPEGGAALEDAMRDVERARLDGGARGSRRQYHARRGQAGAATQHATIPAGPAWARARCRPCPPSRRPATWFPSAPGAIDRACHAHHRGHATFVPAGAGTAAAHAALRRADLPGRGAARSGDDASARSHHGQGAGASVDGSRASGPAAPSPCSGSIRTRMLPAARSMQPSPSVNWP